MTEVMPAATPTAEPIVLQASFQQYAWGDGIFIPRLFGIDAPEGPYAEAWMGSHPAMPSRVLLAGVPRSLLELLRAEGPSLLGADVAQRFGGLPYLLKILSIGRPLSVQVHPSAADARRGFEREEAAGIAFTSPARSYRDPNAKPELFVALKPSSALCGFRPFDELVQPMDDLAEIAAMLPAFEHNSESWKAWLKAYFDLPSERAAPALEAWVDRRTANRDDPRSAWIRLAHDTFSRPGAPDPGLPFIDLLNLVHLEPGDGLFLRSGIVHAYLEGAGVEIMASSDNVVRCGLTSKHVDADELVKVVDFRPSEPTVVRPSPGPGRRESSYVTETPDFELRRSTLPLGSDAEFLARGPEIIVVTRGEASIDGASPVRLTGGGAVFIPDGCEVRIDAHADTEIFRALVPPPANPEFRGHATTALRFGTSGLRGRVEDITDLEAYVNVQGFLDYCYRQGEVSEGDAVVLGGDLRPSTDRILDAAARAIADSRLTVVDCGRLPTPALAAYGLQTHRPTIVVTGSHIPFDRNGMKFYRSRGEVSKSDEEPILVSVERRRRLEYSRKPATSIFADDGSLRLPVAPRTPSEAAREDYVERYRQFFGEDALAGLHVGVFQHSAVGRDLLVEVLTSLGATVSTGGRSEAFVPIDTEALGQDQIDAMQRLATDLEQQTQRSLDALVSTDGDGDRPLVMAVQGGRVRFIGGDMLGILVADALSADAVVVPVSATDAVEEHFEPKGIPTYRTRIGSPWVLHEMEAQAAQHEAIVGFEANGGFMTAVSLERDGRRLEPLPTRDAVLPILTVLADVRTSGKALFEMVDALPSRISRAGLLDDIDPSRSRVLMSWLRPTDDSVRAVRTEGIRWYGTANDGTPADLPGETVSALDLAVESLNARLARPLGLASVQALDMLDGVRVRFGDGDVVHLRPSGNAPQLRVYITSDSEARATELLTRSLADDGPVMRLLQDAEHDSTVRAIRRNASQAESLAESPEAPALVGTVSGSSFAQAFWQRELERFRTSLGAEQVLSLHEDLPVNQAFGLLLLWSRVRSYVKPGRGALFAFVFGEGTRATPFTEANDGQKPAMASYQRVHDEHGVRQACMVELALRQFAPVEAYLRRSGFDGLVVKWGDEVQIPALDLCGCDPRLANADVVRFVSMREMTDDDARNKDWVGVDERGFVTRFIPRRPLSEMESLADRGLLRRDGDRLVGGVNLGSIAVSRRLLDALEREFAPEIFDSGADRRLRPDLDPQLFTALTVAVSAPRDLRGPTWEEACAESSTLAALERNLPGIVHRLGGVVDDLAARDQRPVRIAALDFKDQFWGDIGQHRQIYAYYMALLDNGGEGAIARTVAGVPESVDRDGNRIIGTCRLGPDVVVRDSVLIDVEIVRGRVENCVLIGTQCEEIDAKEAFDVQSRVRRLQLAPRAGSYRMVSAAAVALSQQARETHLFLPDGTVRLAVLETTDLRNRPANYDRPILGNSLSFAEAHSIVTALDPDETEERRCHARAAVDWDSE